MTTAALVLAALAALLHVYIWVMESLTWTSPRTRATFGTSQQEAEATKELAFNQGFYNLFLAVVTGVGVAAHLADEETVGTTLVLTGTGSMLAAALCCCCPRPTRPGRRSRRGRCPCSRWPCCCSAARPSRRRSRG